MALSMKASTARTCAVRSKVAARRTAVVVRADGFIGSAPNVIVVASTTLFLTAARFGLAPSVRKVATPGLKLQDREVGLISNDPSGFTVTDTLAYGAIGHAVAIGVVLGLRALGKI